MISNLKDKLNWKNGIYNDDQKKRRKQIIIIFSNNMQ